MRRQFVQLYGRFSPNRPYLFRSIYCSLTSDSSSSRNTAEEEVDQRMLEAIKAEDGDIIVDLHCFNTNNSDRYQMFWEKCDIYLQSCTSVHE